MKKTDLYNSRVNYAKAATQQQRKQALKKLRKAVGKLLQDLFSALSTFVEAISPLMKSLNNRDSNKKWLQNSYETR